MEYAKNITESSLEKMIQRRNAFLNGEKLFESENNEPQTTALEVSDCSSARTSP